MISAKAIYARLAGDATVNVVIGGGAGGAPRIWPKPAPQDNNLYPRLVYWGDKADTGNTYDGADGLASQKVTISCEALDYASAAELADLVRKSLDGLPRGTYGGTVVQGCFYDDERDEQYVDGEQGEQRLIYAVEADFLIWFET